VAPDVMERSIGSRFGPYEITAILGSGGMGEVYRATDSRLRRDVALKLLTGVEPEDTRRQQRFLQEARAASALNHPNILSVYDIGNENGTQYIVSELLEGESLRSLIQKGPMPLRKFLDIAIQVASGLTAAHEAGIIHRDLKPENIMITRDNRVKILDFGLAKVELPATGTPEEQTRSHLLTHPGAILGTVAYMSPEQAKGDYVDFRSDQFSFGLILYEMATGQQAFHKNTPVQTLSAIITEDPPSISASNQRFPVPMRWMIERCLAKDPRERYGATIDLYHELRAFREHISETSFSGETLAAPSIRGRKKWLTAAAIGAALIAGFVIAAALMPRGTPLSNSYRFTPLAVNPEAENFAQWSPDGKSVAYTVEIDGVQQLFVRSLEASAAEQITRVNHDVLAPYWSADGSRIYYTIKDDKKKYGLWMIGVAGGSPELVFEHAGGGDISPDGKTMVLCMGDEERKLSVWISSPPGSPPKRYTKGIFKDAAFDAVAATFSPDGSRVLLQTSRRKEKIKYWILPFPDGEPQSLDFLDEVYSYGSTWLPDNKRLVLSTHLQEQRYHLSVVDIEKESIQPITNSVSQEWAPDISPDGKRIVFSSGIQQYDLIEVPLDGSAVRNLTTTPVNEKAPAWSPQGNQFAFVSDITGSDVIWVKNPAERLQRPLVTAKDFSDAETDSFSRPFFSPDGKRIVYHRNTKPGLTDIWISSVSGGSPVRLYADKNASQLAPSWSPDGNWIAFIHATPGQMSLRKARIGSSDAPVLLKDNVIYLQPQWSPDGKWLTYLDKDGASIISADGKTSKHISTTPWLTGGWSQDGKTLYSIRQSETRRLLVVATDVELGQERLIADAGVSPILVTDAVFAGFSLAPDGESFATSILKSASDLWVLEDFNPEPPSLFSFDRRF
jgi:serine/threonine protein kinase